jgi:hypothetical protein
MPGSDDELFEELLAKNGSRVSIKRSFGVIGSLRWRSFFGSYQFLWNCRRI